MSWLPPPSTGPRVLLGCTGSVASIKVPELARRLQEYGASVIIIPTENACHFLRCQAKVDSANIYSPNHGGFANIKPERKVDSPNTHTPNHGGFAHIKPERKADNDVEIRGSGSEEENSCSDQCSHCGNRTSIRRKQTDNDCDVKSLYPDLNFVLDHDEWAAWNGRGDPVLHILLRDWAQVMVIAPLDANTMAKIAQGLCDNLLTSIVRAWDVARPLVFCPAMNTHMYNHPLTFKHANILKELGYIEVCVVSKRLACGDVGPGAMAEVDSILNAVMQELPGTHRISHGPF